MDTTTLIIIGAAAIFAFVFVFFLRRLSWGSSPGYTELTPRAAPVVRLDPAAENELRELVARGEKIEAIKRVRGLTGLGLKEAKDYVEQLPILATVLASEPAAETRAAPAPRLDSSTERELRELVARGQKIEAIKRVRELTGLGLKEAKDYVELLPRVAAPIAAELLAETPADTQAVEREARALLESGNTIAAVKRVRELTGWGLKESREYVQSLSPTLPGSAPPPLISTAPTLGDPAADPEVQLQLARGNKIQAIKRVREMTGWGLKEAKDYVDRLQTGG